MPRFVEKAATPAVMSGSDCGKLLSAERFSVLQREAVIRVYDEAGNVIETHEGRRCAFEAAHHRT